MVLSSSLFPSSSPTAPRGHRAYVVGDIHGRVDLLDRLLDSIHADLEARPSPKTCRSRMPASYNSRTVPKTVAIEMTG